MVQRNGDAIVTDHASNDVDRLIDERPGKILLSPVYDEQAVAINEFVYKSTGASASYMVVTDVGRVIVNAGGGWEAPHHRRLFDEVCAGPTPYIITTQGHVDHVGGVAAFREPDTLYVAQANNARVQRDDLRIAGMGRLWASIWFDISADRTKRFSAERPDVPITQDTPTPDLLFERRLGLRIGGLQLELLAAVGETTDSAIVWLPEHRIAFISNLLGPLFPHFPNLNTLRGQKYRFIEPYLDTILTLRDLQPEMLITGRGEPIVGRDLIDQSLERLYGAVDFVHRETLKGMNDGTDLYTLMREIRLPNELRVGEGYGKVSWGVRTIWETYVGWFQHRSTTELYSIPASEVYPDLVELAGADNVASRARKRLDSGEPVAALHLGEALLAHDPQDAAAAAIMADAHRALLGRQDADANFWESGWLRHQLGRWSGEPVGPSVSFR
jgi:glyoxylase-like metal-dependent hydrolase (beta-lactamase superfamily II)